MPVQRTLVNVPDKLVKGVVRDFESENAMVAHWKESDGTWTVSAIAAEPVRSRVKEYQEKLLKAATLRAEADCNEVLLEDYLVEGELHFTSSERSGLAHILGVLGGLLLGASLSMLVNLVLGTPASTLTVAAMVAAGAIGSFLIALDLQPVRRQHSSPIPWLAERKHRSPNQAAADGRESPQRSDSRR